MQDRVQSQSEAARYLALFYTLPPPFEPIGTNRHYLENSLLAPKNFVDRSSPFSLTPAASRNNSTVGIPAITVTSVPEPGPIPQRQLSTSTRRL
ncbi:hypothetical protein Tdes44962_MAKER05409 [Teratosphaeria destructans]|uniref:Uncharacterized protein n=1 Tax=Teratosphaeria destructans TaxID=418781 RepID=A0A9W7SK47_9PEZI|nr:hypothetical protein Tdes44962_MAKER05409 [Teratosphaeria destructans]